jgi:hypothetical protein
MHYFSIIVTVAMLVLTAMATWYSAWTFIQVFGR